MLRCLFAFCLNEKGFYAHDTWIALSRAHEMDLAENQIESAGAFSQSTEGVYLIIIRTLK